MAYSRWSNSYWYTFWSSRSETETQFKWPTKQLKRKQVFEICDMRPFFISYGDLEDDGLGKIINRVKRFYKRTRPNNKPTEEQLRELMDYIEEWRKDVDRHFKFSTFMLYEWYYPIRNKIKRLWKNNKQKPW
jgi:hypothetical protein